MIEIDKFWFEDPTILYNKERLIEFFPSLSMHYIEKLNAILRFAIYASILIFLYTKNIKSLFIPLLIGSITLYIYKFNKINDIEDYKHELEEHGESNIQLEKDGAECQMPTKENPFMNVLISDIENNPKKKKACKITDEKVKNKIEENFNYNLYKDVSDIYSKNNSQREFVSNPSTTIPNNQEEFAKFLYDWGSSCKENPKECLKYEDIRQKREYLD